jgi:hypothetical protein
VQRVAHGVKGSDALLIANRAHVRRVIDELRRRGMKDYL